MSTTATALTGRDVAISKVTQGSTAHSDTEVALLNPLHWAFQANPEEVDMTSGDSGLIKDMEFGRLAGKITAEVIYDPADTALAAILAAGVNTVQAFNFRVSRLIAAPTKSWLAKVVGDVDTVNLSSPAKVTLTFLHKGDFTFDPTV